MGRRPGRARDGAGPTINDVSARAGVSRATVSRVVNGNPSVAADIARKVRAAIEELGYRPNTVAQSLSSGRTATVGVVVPDLGNPTFQQILHGINQAASGAGYRVLVADAEESPEREAGLIDELSLRTDAMVLCSPRMSSASLARVVERIGPLAIVNRDEPVGATRVIADLSYGLASLAEHLIARGHRTVLHLDGPAVSNAQAARARGLEAVREAHPEVTILREPCGSTMEDGYAALEAVRASGATAVIGFNDLVALGLMGRAREEGLSVPCDLSVVGVDDIPFARFAAPALTTLRVPYESIGEAAWLAVEGLLKGQAEADLRCFTPVLIARDSVAPPCETGI